MNDKIYSLEEIRELVKPLAEKYHVERIDCFGSYARHEATKDSDPDFLVYGGKNFKLTLIFSLGEELREILKKDVDIFEIHEVNIDSEFYQTIRKEKVRIY